MNKLLYFGRKRVRRHVHVKRTNTAAETESAEKRPGIRKLRLHACTCTGNEIIKKASRSRALRNLAYPLRHLVAAGALPIAMEPLAGSGGRSLFWRASGASAVLVVGWLKPARATPWSRAPPTTAAGGGLGGAGCVARSGCLGSCSACGCTGTGARKTRTPAPTPACAYATGAAAREATGASADLARGGGAAS